MSPSFPLGPAEELSRGRKWESIPHLEASFVSFLAFAEKGFSVSYCICTQLRTGDVGAPLLLLMAQCTAPAVEPQKELFNEPDIARVHAVFT